MPAHKKSRRGYNLRKDYIPGNPASSLLNDSGISVDSNHRDNLGEPPPKMENTAFRNNENLNVDIDKFPTVCRFCLGTVNVKSIFKLKYNDLSFHRIFESCISVQVAEGDNLPQNVCFLCVNEVIRFYKFIVKTQECDALLKGVLSKYVSEKFQSATIASTENPPATDVLESDFICIIKCESYNSILNEATEKIQATASNDKEPLVKTEPSIAAIPTSENASVAKVCESDFIITNCYHDDGVSNQVAEKVQPIPSNTKGVLSKYVSEKFQSPTIASPENPPATDVPESDFMSIIKCEYDNSILNEETEKILVTALNDKEPLVKTETSLATIASSENASVAKVCESDSIIITNCYHDDGISNQATENGQPTTVNSIEPSVQTETSISRKQIANNAAIVGPQEKPFMCYVCGVRFSLSCSLWRHSKTHTGEKPHVCEVCGTGFTQAASLVAHRETHANKISFTCAHCNKCFSQVLSYKQHLRLQHPKTPETLKKRPNLLQHKCKMCGKLLSSERNLRTHMLSHGEKSYLCNNCGKSFATKVAIQLHMRVHTGVRPYTCKFCNKSFSQQGTLQSHFLIHTGEKPFVCNVCSKAFNHRNALKYHMRTHSGEKPYSCSFCGKSFARKGNLTVHVRTHTGETPYICDICGKGFCDSSTMRRHRRGHAKRDVFSEPGS